MLSLLLVGLLSLNVVNAVAITLSGIHQNQTELPNFPLSNSSVIGTDVDPTNAPSLLGNPIDKDFRTIMKVYPEVKISGKSTYMNVLKAMIKLSYGESTHAYAGETFSFQGYTDVKLRIMPATASSSALQYRYAIWGLFKTVQYLTTNKLFVCVVVDLYWSGDGASVLVGVIEIFPDPMPDIAASDESQGLVRIGRRAQRPYHSLDLANFTSIGRNETDLAASINAGELSVFVKFQGPRLSVPEVFMTIFLALVRIAWFGTGQIVHDFKVRNSITKTELVYERYGAPRESPPFFVYHEAARALAHVAEYMFEQHRFEAVIFVLQVDGTLVGTGLLRKSSSTSIITSQKV